jgi:hypothetical protein
MQEVKEAASLSPIIQIMKDQKETAKATGMSHISAQYITEQE